MVGFMAFISARKAALSAYFGFRPGAGAGSGVEGLGAAASTGFGICRFAICPAGAAVSGAAAGLADTAAGGALRSEQAPSASARMAIHFVYFMTPRFLKRSAQSHAVSVSACNRIGENRKRRSITKQMIILWRARSPQPSSNAEQREPYQTTSDVEVPSTPRKADR